MTQTEKIIDRIYKSGTAQSEEIISQAKTRTNEILSVARLQAETYANEQLQQAQTGFDKELCSAVNMAELEKNKDMLKIKNEIVNEIFNEVLEKLCNMDKKEYKKLIKNILINCAENGDEIILSKNAKIEKSFFTELDVYKKKHLKLAKEVRDFAGGIILENKTSSKIYTFEKLIENKKEQTICDIAKELFV